MALLDFMTEDETELTEETQHLWEDLLPALRKLEVDIVELNTGVLLFEHDIRSYLIDNGVPPKLIYPIMRLNGYENYGDLVSDNGTIRIPVISSLEDLYDEIRNDQGI